MKESYDVAVIGESMSGKSTMISSMFAEEIADKAYGRLQKE